MASGAMNTSCLGSRAGAPGAGRADVPSPTLALSPCSSTRLAGCADCHPKGTGVSWLSFGKISRETVVRRKCDFQGNEPLNMMQYYLLRKIEIQVS